MNIASVITFSVYDEICANVTKILHDFLISSTFRCVDTRKDSLFKYFISCVRTSPALLLLRPVHLPLHLTSLEARSNADICSPFVWFYGRVVPCATLLRELYAWRGADGNSVSMLLFFVSGALIVRVLSYSPKATFRSALCLILIFDALGRKKKGAELPTEYFRKSRWSPVR